MKIKSLLYRSLAEPRLSQLEHAEECLQGQHTKIEKNLAALNMGLYPIESKSKILDRVKRDKIELEKELGAVT